MDKPETVSRRRPEYISPSALAKFEESQDEYYLQYVTPTKPPRFPQTMPMSVGSAFDAYVKSYLHQAIYGKGHPKYELDALLTAQVEPQNLDWARDNGSYVFEKYKESGALSDLMMDINKAVDDPKFEFEVKGTVSGYREGVTKKTMGVPLLGKPDIWFINSEGAHVIFDWKVNGFCAKSNISPMPGYIECLDQKGGSWQRCGPHKDAFIQQFNGMMINTGSYLEMYDPSWATQLATYGWLMGEKVGAEIIIGVDQIACNGAKRVAGRPILRVVKHRTRVSEKYQFEVMARYQDLWSILTDEPFYFFRDRSFESSKEKCDMLDQQASLMGSVEADSDEEWVMKLGRMS